MRLSRILLTIATALLPFAVLATTWLYLYPIFHGCGFPAALYEDGGHGMNAAVAPFRLLALGDPQLEGDSSLPKEGEAAFPSLQRLWALSISNPSTYRFLLTHPRTLHHTLRTLYSALLELTTQDLPRFIQTQRKKLDLLGNDYYLAHIVRSTRWWTRPSHIVVLGDLLGSQWISDEEFGMRAGRYWGRVFEGLEKVPESIMDQGMGRDIGHENDVHEVLGADKSWEKRVINIAGNHDIGYAGDLDEKRIERFERAFGRANWEIIFTLPPCNYTPSSDALETNGQQPTPESPEIPSLRLIILNSMNLDTPALSSPLQTQTYAFLNHIISTSHPISFPVTSSLQFNLLLTHIPLHKESGICYDDPFFDFFKEEEGGGVKEQNMLSEHASKGVLEGVFGLSGNGEHEMGRAGVVINGHDHEGCDVIHYVERTSAAKTDNKEDRGDTGGASAGNGGEDTPRLKEITLRSMMGDYSGAAYFLSAWWDPNAGGEGNGEWRMEVGMCKIGVAAWWWGVHVLDLLVIVLDGQYGTIKWHFLIFFDGMERGG
ncbi:hypothetical protein GQ43DRAFT_458466 [Delitschia confertaspora ATCC 74209]|uniref:Calcineurin-like phosphoesterase domain-containing protein n=1 Tax=Delitschia confertaspora ATCC 74209 TaxID=1513339 RepID=A0A9P4JGE8_9PLEO|nr:hypothetical protein GQ43DRAFT_458466 [Delitschia confertaspora ATCC 74209]